MKHALNIYFLIIYYFSFFYLFNIYSSGNFMFISGVKEILIIFLLLWMVICRNFGKNFHIKKNILILILLYGCVLLGASIHSYTLEYVYIDLKYYFIWPLMIYISAQLFSNFKNFKRLVFHVNIICLIIGCMGLICFVKQYVPLLQWRSAFRLYAIKSILSTSFDFGSLMAIAVLFNLIVLYNERIRTWQIVLIVFYASLTYFSFTRGSYISLILFVYLFIREYFLKELRLIKKREVFKIFSDLVVIGLSIYIFIHFSEKDVFSTDSLIDRIKNTWPSLKNDSLLLGSGFGTVGRSANSTALFTVTDNSFLRIILTMGFAGLIIMLIIFRSIYRNAKNKWMLTIIYISVGCTAFFSDYIVFTPTMILVYTLIGAGLNTNFKEQYNKYRRIRIA